MAHWKEKTEKSKRMYTSTKFKKHSFQNMIQDAVRTTLQTLAQEQIGQQAYYTEG
jgi:hypothetical protein